MSLGPNATLIGAPDARARLSTPCLLLEADAFEHNLAAMMELVRRHGRAAAAARQGAQMRGDRATPARGRRRRPVLRHGARGGGDGRGWPRRASRHLAGDRARHGRAARAGARARRRSRCGGRQRGGPRGSGCGRQRRARRSAPWSRSTSGRAATGVTSPADAVRLARRIEELPQLRYRGVQAYYGHLQHVPAYADRRARVAEQWAAAAARSSTR